MTCPCPSRGTRQPAFYHGLIPGLSRELRDICLGPIPVLASSWHLLTCLPPTKLPQFSHAVLKLRLTLLKQRNSLPRHAYQAPYLKGCDEMTRRKKKEVSASDEPNIGPKSPNPGNALLTQRMPISECVETVFSHAPVSLQTMYSFRASSHARTEEEALRYVRKMARRDFTFGFPEGWFKDASAHQNQGPTLTHSAAHMKASEIPVEGIWNHALIQAGRILPAEPTREAAEALEFCNAARFDEIEAYWRRINQMSPEERAEKENAGRDRHVVRFSDFLEWCVKMWFPIHDEYADLLPDRMTSPPAVECLRPNRDGSISFLRIPSPDSRPASSMHERDLVLLPTAVRLAFGDVWRESPEGAEVRCPPHQTYQSYCEDCRARQRAPLSMTDYAVTTSPEYDFTRKAMIAGKFQRFPDPDTCDVLVKPSEFLQWVRSKGFPIHRYLRDLLPRPGAETAPIASMEHAVDAEKDPVTRAELGKKLATQLRVRPNTAAKRVTRAIERGELPPGPIARDRALDWLDKQKEALERLHRSAGRGSDYDDDLEIN